MTLYQRSREIEQRLDTVLRLIRSGRFSTPMLAEELGVSIPTVSRCVSALRDRGHDIRSEKHADGWCYVLVQQPKMRSRSSLGQVIEAAR
jgi:biotin operon repressor